MQKKVLIIQTAFLGDVLLSIPLLKRLNELNYEVSYLCREGLGDYLLATGLVKNSFEIKKSDKNSYKRALKSLPHYDLLLCPHQSLRSALFMNSVSADQKITFRNVYSCFLNVSRIKRNMQLPDALRQLSLLSAVDEDTRKLIERGESLDYSKSETTEELSALIHLSTMKVRIETNKVGRLHLPDRYICIAPGSRWLTKRWTIDGFKRVAKSFHDDGYNILCVGSLDEKSDCDEVVKGLENATSVAGQVDLIELHQTLSKALLLVSNDSGAMHMASAAGIPCVSVFGPTVPSMGYRPWNPQSVIIQDEALLCRPCGKHGHMTCPIGTHECMRGIQAERVILASRRYFPEQKAPLR
jgi:heptosyltransferase-2